jgi:hypothetical protein
MTKHLRHRTRALSSDHHRDREHNPGDNRGVAGSRTCVRRHGADDRLGNGVTDALVTAVAPDLEISPATPDIGFVHRRSRDTDVYVVINTGPKADTFALATRTSRRSYEQWDARSGHVLRSGTASESIELTLHPYEATVIVLSDQPVTQISAEARVERRLPLSGPWQVAYGDEPAQPVELPHIWEDERGREHYSGAASYTTTIELDGVDGQASIDFGDCDVLDGGATEHDLVGPSYRVAVRGPVGRSPRYE